MTDEGNAGLLAYSWSEATSRLNASIGEGKLLRLAKLKQCNYTSVQKAEKSAMQDYKSTSLDLYYIYKSCFHATKSTLFIYLPVARNATVMGLELADGAKPTLAEVRFVGSLILNTV